MEELTNLLTKFKSTKVLVVGDIMIDSYLWGKVNRISPEAPVPVVAVSKKENRLGGAANVAMNIAALGATPIMVATVGNDDNGEIVKSLLSENNLSCDGIVVDQTKPTIVKTRVISSGQHMLRIDEEINNDIADREEEAVFQRVKALVESNKIGAIVLEDYNKGLLTEKLISNILEFAQRHNIPVTVDPKKKNFFAYKGVSLFKPNLKELSEGIKIDIDPASDKSILNAIEKLNNIINAKVAFITLSEHGVFCKSENFEGRISAHKREIADVSGAGDTVIAVATLCLACGADEKTLAELSNLAGGLVCEEVGVVPLSLDKLEKEARKIETVIYGSN